MNETPRRIFREAAIDRLSSPDHLDRLVGVTRPIDWLASATIALALAALIVWGVVGRVPTRVSAEGIVTGDAGRIAEAIAASAGRLASIDVGVGQAVAEGQPIAHVAQADIDARHRAAAAVLGDREREGAELAAAMAREQGMDDSSFAAREVALRQSIAVAKDRAATRAKDLETVRGLVGQGLSTQPELEQVRADLDASRQLATDDRNEMLTLAAEHLERKSRRAHDLLLARFRIDDARRDADRLADTVNRDTRVLSPIAGTVTEIEVSPGAVLATGTPVATIETMRTRLQALIYLPAQTGKMVKPGMEARIMPSTVKSEEYGAMLGRVISISEFPATPEGLAATLHNRDLVARFARSGPLYAAVVRLRTNAAAPSGYLWSSGLGPPLRITPGTLARADIVTARRRPVDLLLPLMRRLSGIGR
ncbi:MAG TPA: NHLP bacteriocin system secretion protein [Caulobacteraceae bacterium]|jgi:HlyD family secretion protein